MIKFLPDFFHEQQWANKIIVGIDEVGRGSWAGPLIVGAVILDQNNYPKGLNDSKKLSPSKRHSLYLELMGKAICAVGIVSAIEVDELKLTAATGLAIERAFDALSIKPDHAIIDGTIAFKLPCRVSTLIGGDAKSLSIAAASIVAKVTRDKLMQELAVDFPYYGWDSNVGYGTKLHMDAINTHGITIHHRKSFAPIREYIECLDGH